MWGILGSVCMNDKELMMIEHVLQIFVHFLNLIFTYYLLWSSVVDWLQIVSDTSWRGSIPNLWKLCWFSIFLFLPIFSSTFQRHFSNAISSEVDGPIDFIFHVGHPVDGLYQMLWKLCCNSNFSIFANFFFNFSTPFFNSYLLCILWNNQLHILCKASWGVSLPLL